MSMAHINVHTVTLQIAVSRLGLRTRFRPKTQSFSKDVGYTIDVTVGTRVSDQCMVGFNLLTRQAGSSVATDMSSTRRMSWTVRL